MEEKYEIIYYPNINYFDTNFERNHENGKQGERVYNYFERTHLNETGTRVSVVKKGTQKNAQIPSISRSNSFVE